MRLQKNQLKGPESSKNSKRNRYEESEGVKGDSEGSTAPRKMRKMNKQDRLEKIRSLDERNKENISRGNTTLEGGSEAESESEQEKGWDEDSELEISNVLKEGKDEEELEALQLIKELAAVLRKSRMTANDTSTFFQYRDAGLDEFEVARSKAKLTNRYLTLASSIIRNIELLADNMKLKSEIQVATASTQCSPTYFKVMKALTEEKKKERSDKNNRQNSRGKAGKKSREIRDKPRIGEETEGIEKNREDGVDAEVDKGEESVSRSDREGEWRLIDRKKKEEEKKREKEKKKREQEEEKKKRKEEETRNRVRKIPQPPKTEAIVVKTSG